MTASATHPPGFEAEIPAIRARITLAGTFSTAPNPLEAVTWRYTPYFEAVPDEAMTLEWFLRVFDDLRNFLCFCTFGVVAAESINVFLSEDDHEGAGVFRNTWLVKSPEPVAPHQMIVRLPVIRPSIEATLLEWFALSGVARPAIELFCGVLFGGTGISTYSFLALAQAAEAYHRCTHEGTYESSEAYDEHLSEIKLPEGLPKPLRKKLKDVLKYGNELSLRKRLTELFDGLGPLRAAVSRDSKEAVSEIVDARNALTHQTKGVARPPWPRLAYLSRVLQLLLLGTTLRRIGVPEPVVREGLEGLAVSLRFVGQP